MSKPDLFTRPNPDHLPLPERCAALAREIEDFEASPTRRLHSLNLTQIRLALEQAAEALK